MSFDTVSTVNNISAVISAKNKPQRIYKCIGGDDGMQDGKIYLEISYKLNAVTSEQITFFVTFEGNLEIKATCKDTARNVYNALAYLGLRHTSTAPTDTDKNTLFIISSLQ